MYDEFAVAGVDCGDHLHEELRRITLTQPTLVHNVSEELTTANVLCDQIDVRLRFDHLEELEEVWVDK